jgi:hypothetical protein
MGHDGKPGTDAVPCAVHVTFEPDSMPLAVPETRTSPGQLALNVPLALVPVCCVTFHRKSVQAPGAGTTLEDVQLPRSAAVPVVDGPTVLVRS